MSRIFNAANVPLNAQAQGTVPNMTEALDSWLQPMSFEPVTKTPMGYQVVETTTAIGFQGVWQPFRPVDLRLLPEGQRARRWYWCHSKIALPLNVDDCIVYLGVQYRVMGINPCGLYGFFEHQLVEDWTGSGPSTP